MARELVISFLYGEFTAAMVDGARVIERWSPSASDRAHGFHEAAFRYFLESAVEHFDCAGEEAVLVVGDVEMEHHQVSLPPVNKQQRQQLFRRSLVARFDSIQDLCHVGHEHQNTTHSDVIQ